MATILVVDDELGIRELLYEILSDEGHVVVLADNARAAISYRNQEVPDLVLLDIWMPGMDGLTLLRDWSVRGLLTMPVIMMSGHSTIDTAVEATKIGAIQYLEKPIALHKLLDSVGQALSRKVGLPSRPVTGVQLTTSKHASVDVEPNVLAHSPVEANATTSATAAVPLAFTLPLREARDSFEKAYLEYHLRCEKGVITKVAQRTGLERTHLYRKFKQLGIDVNEAKEQ